MRACVHTCWYMTLRAQSRWRGRRGVSLRSILKCWQNVNSAPSLAASLAAFLGRLSAVCY
jgi:hypothetical protein